MAACWMRSCTQPQIGSATSRRRRIRSSVQSPAVDRDGINDDAHCSVQGPTRSARNAHCRPAMHMRIGPSLLVVFILGAAGLALFQRSSSAGPTPMAPVTSVERAPTTPGLEPFETQLPPNHPPISPKTAESSFAPDESPPALAWTPPRGWEVAPNRSPMRLATYRVSGPAGAAGGAELTVTRAGGTAADNLERWVGQFDSAGPDKRTERTVRGFHVSTLEVGGTYEGGMTKAGSETAHPGWALLGAVVETDGPFYFFKMVGPADAVGAARPAFDVLLSSVRKPG